ncbi:MAG: hypothetical protein Kow0097_11830 [Candidatus Bipolaricaulota bacterium]
MAFGIRDRGRAAVAMVASEVVTMRIVGLREPRDHATKLLRGRDPVLVMRHDKVAGVLLPLDGDDLALELRREQLRIAASIR